MTAIYYVSKVNSKLSCITLQHVLGLNVSILLSKVTDTTSEWGNLRLMPQRCRGENETLMIFQELDERVSKWPQKETPVTPVKHFTWCYRKKSFYSFWKEPNITILWTITTKNSNIYMLLFDHHYLSYGKI